jgi:hypothetical protein
MRSMLPETSSQQIRAQFTQRTIRVYQAYSAEIADGALQAQTFVPPFRLNRMTWIKPSFLWMMYRSGWATKKGQERIHAIDITRMGFEWCLDNACLTHFDPTVHVSRSVWQHARDTLPVLVQFDPERSIRLDRLVFRTIQIGLSGVAVDKYIHEWIVGISDVTSVAHEIWELLKCGDDDAAKLRLPWESHYPCYAPHLGITS